MILTAWNNGKHSPTGAGYGLKVPIEDRDRYFERSWGTVILELPTETGNIEVEANVDKDSFWGPNCRELINRKMGRWLIDEGLAPWPKGNPPKFEAAPKGEGRFVVKSHPV